MKQIEEKKISEEPMRVGTKLIKQLSSTFYPNVRMVFDEMVSNASDAFATTVKIYIGEDKITIEDNGIGMTPEQLARFFYISYTEKGNGAIKSHGDIKRTIIGKFGIGKLTLYRLCTSFEITSWRDGKAAKAKFDFTEFEKKDFIDEFKLYVENVDNFQSSSSSGTRITLTGLKQILSAKDVKRDLQRTMPLVPDFIILISGIGISGEVTLQSEDILAGGTIHEIKETDVEKVGKVSGRIVFFGTLPRGEKVNRAGVYVRVHGRIVNYEDADKIIDLKDISHAIQFQRNVQAEINADGLNSILLTNRSGFVEDSEQYKEFKKWVRKIVTEFIEKEYTQWKEDRKEIETIAIPQAAADIIENSLIAQEENKHIIEAWKKRLPSKLRVSSREVPKKSLMRTPETGKTDKTTFAVHGINISIVVEPKGESAPEAYFDKNTQTVIINSLHPLYILSRSKGKLWGTLYHSIKASIVVVALEISKDLQEFKKLYDDMLIDAPQKMRQTSLRKTRKNESEL